MLGEQAHQVEEYRIFPTVRRRVMPFDNLQEQPNLVFLLQARQVLKRATALIVKKAGPLEAPEVTTKSAVLLKTCPVGAPPGIETSRVLFTSGLPPTSPE